MKTRYSDNLDTLVALVTNLAMTKHKARTPSKLAKRLSLDEGEVLLVLESFRGLFRKSRRKKSASGEHYYVLQLRYARRWIEEEAEDEDDPDPREPLEPEYLAILLDFITKQADHEQAHKRQRSSNVYVMVGAWIAAVAAIIAAVLSLANPDAS